MVLIIHLDDHFNIYLINVVSLGIKTHTKTNSFKHTKQQL